MQSVAGAAFASWNLDPGVIVLLILIASIYVRGWMRGRRHVRDVHDGERLAAFLAGLAVLFLSGESPLDSFDSLFLAAHMAQHLLLMMIAPPLILLGQPMLPLLRGLPKTVVKEGLGPFLTWRPLRRFFGWLISPPVAWLVFAFSTIFWHLPQFYELALRSTQWHAVQHASFFWTGVLFWWPIVRPGPGRYRWPLWVGIPYLASADLINTALSAFFIFSGKLLYPTYEAMRIGGLTAREDQTLAGAIMWVPGSLIYLLPAVGIVMRMLSTGRDSQRSSFVRGRATASGKQSVMKRFSLPRWRRVAQGLMLLLAVAVMADGFFGPQVAPLNLAGVLPWIHWRAFSVMAILLVGNLFCLSCPLTFVRDIGRGVLPARFRWPRALRNKWLPIALLLVYLWAYEAFSFWESPWATAWLVAAYFLAALLIDGFFRGASFCKYVCPIGQFHFIGSLISPREIRVRKEEVCRACRTHDCIRGNRHARGCELYLFQPKKAGNLDCTFCLDCVKACPHDNIGLLSIAPAATLLVDPYRSSIGKLSRRTDFAALALLIVFAGFVNAAGMVSPVMMWEHSWHARLGGSLGASVMPVIVAAFIFAGTVLAPALAVAICAALNRLTGEANLANGVRRFVFALLPVGFSMWVAHLLYHLVTSGSAALPALQRALSAATQTAISPYLASWLTPLQLLLLDAGLLLSLYVCWRIGKQIVKGVRPALALSAPWAALSCVLYVTGVWILLQPMEMRGMIH